MVRTISIKTAALRGQKRVVDGLSLALIKQTGLSKMCRPRD